MIIRNRFVNYIKKRPIQQLPDRSLKDYYLL